MTPPHVTIVVPTRERPALLRTTLHSILASAAEAEGHGVRTRVLVIDDASPTDATHSVATRLRVDYHRNPVHDGRDNPASAIALGIRLVETPYYALFGDDDIMLPRYVRLHVEALERGNDVVSTAFVRTDADLRPVRESIPDTAHLGDLLAGRIMINDGSMVRTELVRDLPWDPDLEQQILYPIWLELMIRGCRFHLLDEPTFLYRRHFENVSDRRDERDKELRRQIQERYRAMLLDQHRPIPQPRPRPVRPGAHRTGARPPRPLWRRALSRLRRAISR